MAAYALNILINGRVESPAWQFEELFHKAIQSSTAKGRLDVQILETESFHPAQPQPTHRM